MAKKKKEPTINRTGITGHIENAGLVVNKPIVETLMQNYMPYAMSVIVSRAIPEIDGFKPSHRKILYTMYKMGLLGGGKIKSANIVGQTMRLNPHGDMAIYDTLVRLSRGYGSLLVPYIDSKGNFGRAYSRDMAYAASRYTEAGMEKICQCLFNDIDKDTVDFQDNYDNSMKEPSLLPVMFPTILVNNNTGIAVGMASNICSFNLKEVCETTIARIKNKNSSIIDTLKSPDFPGGGYIIYNEDELEKVYKTGKGSIKVRCKYTYDKSANCIDITEIPPTTTVEAIVDKIVDLVKQGKIREISDIRDETDLSGLKITIDLKRGTDADKLMQKLCRQTTLEDTFSCNFNVLIAGNPKVLGVGDLINEWIAFRKECVRRGIYFDLGKKQDKLHLLKGLKRILMDIDKAISIIRETEEEKDVVPNLMIGFGIDKIQAEFVAEIKLRHLNREYILKRTQDIESLRDEIEKLEDILADNKKVEALIIGQLKDIIKEYGKPRQSEILYVTEEETADAPEEPENYAVKLFFTKEGYFKKITPLSYRMSGEQKLKENDEIIAEVDACNNSHILFFTNKGQVYKTRGYDFQDTKTSVMGDYLPTTLEMDADEMPVKMVVTDDYKGYIVCFFENGKASKVELSQYETKTNRKKLVGAYSTVSPLAAIMDIREDMDILVTSNGRKQLIVNTAMISLKATKNTQGIQVMTLRKKDILVSAEPYVEGSIKSEHRLRCKNIPAAGVMLKEQGEQMSLL